MKKLILIAVFVFLVSIKAFGQTECKDAPQTCVLITRAAAVAALQAGDKLAAVEAESKVKDAAIAGLRDELNKMRIEFAEKAGENTALKQNAVADRAIITILLKSVRPKKIGLINLF